ncbi:MAG: hypothetical protein ACYDAG_07065 [Chloroflexota bacterium]
MQPIVDWFEDPEGEAQRIVDLTPEHVLAVDDMVELYRDPGDHPHKNRGEIATVYGALQLLASGLNLLVAVDDQLAKELCRVRHIPHADTPHLIVEMACGGALPRTLGARIWREGLFANNRGRWGSHDEWLQRECPDLCR